MRDENVTFRFPASHYKKKHILDDIHLSDLIFKISYQDLSLNQVVKMKCF